MHAACLKSEWNGINFFCFSRSHEEILSNVMTWFSLKSWPRTRAILRWFHGFSTNTDASPLRILCARTLCFTWTRATIQRRLQSWFLLTDVSKSWSRTWANLPWFHCFSTNTDASPGYYASPGHYASPGLEQQFNVGSSHDFFCLMFLIFILPPLFRVTSHHHHTLCMLD